MVIGICCLDYSAEKKDTVILKQYKKELR